MLGLSLWYFLIVGILSLILINIYFILFTNNIIFTLFFLILLFLNLSSLLLICGANFIAFLFILIYASAILIIFLVLVMVLGSAYITNSLSRQTKQQSYLIVCLIVFMLVGSVSFYSLSGDGFFNYTATVTDGIYFPLNIPLNTSSSLLSGDTGFIQQVAFLLYDEY